MNTAIIIPVRMNSVRLPGKPSALIGDVPMMICVGRNAERSNVGKVIFACAEKELCDIAEQNGFSAILTDPKIKTGTDRVYEASKTLDANFRYIINLQGDLPFIKPSSIEAVHKLILNNDSDIATIASLTDSSEDVDNPSVVKVIFSNTMRAIYFSRSMIPYGSPTFYKHIGVYAFIRESLDKFVKLPQSSLEKTENLEQLRALENNMIISVGVVKDEALTVDTKEDLELSRAFIAIS
jgi:3-deoxy-manno-octulosonate cytidylyltransferase (CMP-KDO synthetase)